MKTRFLTILAILLAGAALSSCADHRDDHMEEFQTMIYFRNGGEQAITLYRTGEEAVYKIPVCKSGRNLSGTIAAEIIPFDEAQMQIYNVLNETDYLLIPRDYYVFTGADGETPLKDQDKVYIYFNPDESYKVLHVRINTVAVSALAEENPDKQPVLALELFSEGNVSKDINYILLTPSIDIPMVSFLSPGVETHKYTSASPLTETYTNFVTISLDDNHWDFTCDIEVMDEDWLQEYNYNNGKAYEMLPANAYSLNVNQVEIKKGEYQAAFEVTLSRESMDMLKEYALPITITGCSNSNFAIDEKNSVYVINVRLDPDKITLTEDMVTVSHNQSNDGDGAPALVDDNILTYWHSPWSSMVTDPDPQFGVYVDIALKSPLKAIVMSYCTRQQNTNGVPTHVLIGVSNDKTNWTVLCDESNSEMASATGGQWITLPVCKSSTSFKYIRLGIADSVAGSLTTPSSGAWTSLSEIELYGTDN
ncbi:MAG: DUF1735 domain-containing protein [Bacteroidales bacterium]|nr:DUF1735 domain-containing protein [Bacteroidales bacterium]